MVHSRLGQLRNFTGPRWTVQLRSVTRCLCISIVEKLLTVDSTPTANQYKQLGILWAVLPSWLPLCATFFLPRPVELLMYINEIKHIKKVHENTYGEGLRGRNVSVTCYGACLRISPSIEITVSRFIFSFRSILSCTAQLKFSIRK